MTQLGHSWSQLRQSCPRKHLCQCAEKLGRADSLVCAKTCAIDLADDSRSVASGRHAVDQMHQRYGSHKPTVSRDSRNTAVQSIRTGTPGRLTSTRTLAGMLTDTDDISAHWNTRLFHWNTRANPSVPDQICTQRPESHNAHIFSVI